MQFYLHTSVKGKYFILLVFKFNKLIMNLLNFQHGFLSHPKFCNQKYKKNDETHNSRKIKKKPTKQLKTNTKSRMNLRTSKA